MRIVSLHPFATDTLDYCGVGWDLVGITHVCSVPKNATKAKILTTGRRGKFIASTQDLARVAQGLTSYEVDIEQMIDCVPDFILAEVAHPDKDQFIPWAEGVLYKALGKRIAIRHLDIKSLKTLYTTMEEIGRLIGKRERAAKLVGEIQFHVSEWVDSYTVLCKGKKVVVLSEASPYIVEAGWMDDLIRLFGAQPLERRERSNCGEVPWTEIVTGRPDVIFVAPHNAFLNQSVRRLTALETAEGWEDLPAVKRGAVFFAPGTDIYRPGPQFLKGVAALVSAIAGLDRPIIPDQDDTYRIRHVELYRHKLLGRP
jgi:iron complex transport system substrate-binding protein